MPLKIKITFQYKYFSDFYPSPPLQKGEGGGGEVRQDDNKVG